MNARKVLNIALGVVIAVAVIYMLVYFFIYRDKSSNVSYQAFGQPFSSGNSTYRSLEPDELNLDRILVGVKGDKYRYVKVDLTFKMENEAQKEKIKENVKQLREIILLFTSTKNGDDLATTGGKNRYKEELKDLVYQKFGYRVKDVYFRNFVLAD